MIEKVNPCHPDKIADRIAGAIVDVAYSIQSSPKIAVEVLIGHGKCHIISETSVSIGEDIIKGIVNRIAGKVEVDYTEVAQDVNLANNQKDKIRCGDNGIFKGSPLTEEQKRLSEIAHHIYDEYRSDGKYILDNEKLILCQSDDMFNELIKEYPNAIVNPLGYWTGGTDVDTGATNRKLGSDMANSITGGGLHGKDASKGDVSINIYAFLKAQDLNRDVEISCAIGDEYVDGKSYSDIVNQALEYIRSVGGFEKFAEWGLY